MPTSLTLRTVKGSPLTNAEVDGNFSSLRDEKIERDGSIAMTGKLTLVAPNTSRANIRLSEGAADPTSPSTGDFWNNTGVIKFRKDGSTTVNIITSETGQTFSGDVVISGNLTVNGSTTTINSTQLSVDDKNIILGDVSSPTDTTADGGGITLKGTLDKTFNWVDATDSWTSSEHLDLANGKAFKINTANVLSSTTLGSSVVSSSLTAVGTITSGTWTGTTIAIANGGTGATSSSAAATNLGLGTGNNVQHASLGIGTAASGTAGEIRATNEVTAYYSSDARLKENVTVLPDALAKVLALRGVSFDWTQAHLDARGGEDGFFVRKHDVGVIAQEVEAVLPEVVADREDGTKAVKYEKMIPLLIEAIKTLKAELDEVKSRCNCTT
jgi:hypothetical protein